VKKGVAAIPLSPFIAGGATSQRIVRFCFAKREQTLQQALDRLATV
jgi:methionine aminotransferase